MRITANANVTAKDQRGYNLARKAADLSVCRYKMGAAIVRGGNVLSINHNALKTHTDHAQWPHWVCSQHAEMRAVILARCDIRGAIMYVARVGGNEISKPCVHCYNVIRLAGIREIVYSDGKKLIKVKVM